MVSFLRFSKISTNKFTSSKNYVWIYLNQWNCEMMKLNQP